MSEPVPSTSIEAGLPVPARAGRARWVVALAVTTIALVVAVVAFFLAAGAPTVSRLAGWVPAGAVAYAELRLDPPGDQGTKVSDLLGHLPGFADRAQLGAKVAETADRLLKAATGGKVDYGAISPWLGDTVAVAAGGPRPADDPSSGSSVLIVAASKDAARADAWVSSLASGLKSTRQAHGGTEMTVLRMGSSANAIAVLDGVVLAGDLSLVEGAIDTRGAGPLRSEPSFRAAVASIKAPVVAFAWAQPSGALRAAPAAAAALPSPFVAPLGSLASRMASAGSETPAWAAASVRAESDALVIDLELAPTRSTSATAAPSTAAPGSSAAATFPPPVNRVGVLASRLPETTLVAVEVRDLGPVLIAALAQLSSSDALGVLGALGDLADLGGGGQLGQLGNLGQLGQLGNLVGLLGGERGLLGWMGDGVLVALPPESSTPGAPDASGGQGSTASPVLGLVVAAADSAAASQEVGSIRALLGLAGAAGASGIAVRTESAGGTSITVVTVAPPGSDTSIGIAFAARDDVVVISPDERFVRAILEVAPGRALSDVAAHRTAIERAGASNAGEAWIDVAGMAGIVASQLPPDVQSVYERDLRPQIGAVGGAAGALLAGGGMRVRFVVAMR